VKVPSFVLSLYIQMTIIFIIGGRSMLQTNLGDIISNVLRWLILPEKTICYNMSEQGYFGKYKIVSLKEPANRNSSSESYFKNVFNIVDQSYCLQCDPRFHDFLLNLPKPNIKYHRKRSSYYRYIK
jgi:hypothetical protein